MKNHPYTTNGHHFRVAIFGSARIKRDDPRYRQIHHLAKLIAREGFDVVTGGGQGIMDAANSGHQAGRGKNHDIHSFGLNIRISREQITNKHLDVKKEFDRFSERLDFFMYLSHVVVVAPGGIGTLLEFLYTWQLIQVRQIQHIHIVLLGEIWEHFMDWIKEWPLRRHFISKQDLDFVFLAKNVKEAMKVIKRAHHEYLKRKQETGNGKQS